MSDAKRPDPRRRSPTSRPGAAGRAGAPGRTPRRKPAASSPTAATARREPRRDTRNGAAEAETEAPETLRQSIAEAIEHASEQRLGFTARRAAILAAVVCILTLTIAGPVRTYFAQRTEMQQLEASRQALEAQIAELQAQKDKLADPAYIAAQARERLGFVMPGDIPYQVQLPPGALKPDGPETDAPAELTNTDPWYTSLWKTIADEPHGAPPPPEPAVPDVIPGEVPPPPPADPSTPGG
jgi:cell division protein FtsB